MKRRMTFAVSAFFLAAGLVFLSYKSVSQPVKRELNLERLLDEAKLTLKTNTFTDSQGNQFVRPNKIKYQGQWFWDSCFQIIGLSHYQPDLAQAELKSLLDSQQPSGLIPLLGHIQGRIQKWVHQKDGNDSGIIQPPILADAILRLNNAQKISNLNEVVNKISKYYDYLAVSRDTDQDGLIEIIHPWESGWDNSPRWDQYFSPKSDFLRRARYVELVRRFKDCNYQISCMYQVTNLKVAAVDINSLYYHNLMSLAELWRRLKNDDRANLYEQRAQKTKEAILAKMWDGKTNFFYDLDDQGKQIQVLTPAGFFPLYAGIVDQPTAAELVKHLKNPKEFWTEYPLPTVASSEKTYQPANYWRGPAWVNINWFVIEGLKNYQQNDLAEQLQQKTLAMINNTGFYEYFNSQTGEGLGTNFFSWTAALTIDLIENTK